VTLGCTHTNGSFPHSLANCQLQAEYGNTLNWPHNKVRDQECNWKQLKEDYCNIFFTAHNKNDNLSINLIKGFMFQWDMRAAVTELMFSAHLTSLLEYRTHFQATRINYIYINLKWSGYYSAYFGSFGCNFLGKIKHRNLKNQQIWNTVNMFHKVAERYWKSTSLPSVNDQWKHKGKHNKKLWTRNSMLGMGHIPCRENGLTFSQEGWQWIIQRYQSPPIFWVSYWKRQKFPKPTAQPAVANRYASLLSQYSLSSSQPSSLHSGLHSTELNLLPHQIYRL